MSEIWHVLPQNDLKEHSENINCECKPTIKELDFGDLIVVHNSYDGREGLELALEVLNKKNNG